MTPEQIHGIQWCLRHPNAPVCLPPPNDPNSFGARFLEFANHVNPLGLLPHIGDAIDAYECAKNEDPLSCVAAILPFLGGSTVRAGDEFLRGLNTISPVEAAEIIRSAPVDSNAMDPDVFHRAAAFAVDDIASNGQVFINIGGDGQPYLLVQAYGGVNGRSGYLEWIVDSTGTLTHQRFVDNPLITGVPNG